MLFLDGTLDVEGRYGEIGRRKPIPHRGRIRTHLTTLYTVPFKLASRSLQLSPTLLTSCREMSANHETDSAKTAAQGDTSIGTKVGEGVSYVVLTSVHNYVCSTITII
jgi:hypothetical protein